MNITTQLSSLISTNPAIANAINVLLSSTGTGITLEDVHTVVSDSKSLEEALRADVAGMTSNIEAMRAEIAKLKAAPAAAPVEVHAAKGMPAGRTSAKVAKDVFAGPSGETSDLLDFEVPCYEWEHAHPLVPAIDVSYKFRLEMLVDFLWAVATGKNTWLYGHTGTGKTTFIEQVCARLNWPVSRINLDSGIERVDLLGKTGLKSEGGATVTVWEDGLIPQAMQNGHFLIIDEIDFGRSDVIYAIQRALEGKGLVLTEDGGRFIQPHPMFRISATANTRGQGDEHGLYQGAKVQSTALLNRFPVWMEVGYLDEEDEAKLLTEVTSVSPEDAASFARFAREIRVAFSNGELNMPLSPREIVPMVEAFQFFSLRMTRKAASDRALQVMVMRKTTPDNRVRIEEIANRTLSIA